MANHLFPKLSLSAELVRGEFSLSVETEVDLSGVTAILGKSGAGKSSLLRIIAGLDKVPNASVVFGDEPWQTIAVGKNKTVWLPSYKRRIGYVFQHNSLFEHLTVEDNLDYARKRTIINSQEKADCFSEDEILDSLGVRPLMPRTVQGLSGGEKQRVAIARALISKPQLLIMDEPVSALDAASKEEVLKVIQWVHQSINVPMLYVSHSLSEVARLADKVLLVKEGRVISQGEVAPMLLHPEISLDDSMPIETIVDAKVVEVDEVYGLCRLEFTGGDLWVNNANLSFGQFARARILARDLSLTLDKATNTSIQNIVSVSISGFRNLSNSHSKVRNQCIVELDANGCTLLAQITQRSVDRLGLTEGQTVFAQIKSVALLV